MGAYRVYLNLPKQVNSWPKTYKRATILHILGVQGLGFSV